MTETTSGMPLVLMYHSVTPDGPDPYHITVPPDRLDEQMRWLARRGLRGVSMRTLLASRAAGRAAGLVGLTFDDGYADFVPHALPVLARYGFSATVFVVAGELGGVNGWDARGPRKALMGADDVRHVAGAGIEIGSHGLRHRALSRAAGGDLHAEVVTSREVLADVLGARITGFCYPYGDLSLPAEQAVRDAGYEYACATWDTAARDRHALPRTYIGSRDTGLRMRAKRYRHRLTWGAA
jgi:peptidoglycan/xylan/chitin deacetylase (PgdA/CDA1 family)